MRGALVFGLLCSLAAVLLVMRVVWRLGGAGPALLGAIIASQLAIRSWVNGMEGPAVLLGVALVLTALVAAAEVPEPRRFMILGLACSVLVLARLDFALVVLVVPFALTWRTRSWRSGGWWTVGAAVIAVPFSTWWLAHWKHLLTVSAVVKNASVAQAIRERFGGRTSVAYVHYLAERAEDYLSSLRLWSSTDRLTIGSSGFTRLLAFGLLALAVLGWFTTALRSSAVTERHRPRFGPCAWGTLVVFAMLALKAIFDLAVAPFWAAGWYSAPQRLAAGFVVGAGAWRGLQWLFRRAAPLAYVALAAIVLTAVPLNATDWNDDAHQRRESTSWLDQIDLASNWIIRHGPEGRYGANDAGLLGHRLDRVHSVVNLDGLVNDYAVADLVIDNVSRRRRISDTRIDYFVGRLTQRQLDEQLACGKTLWASPGKIPYSDLLHAYSVGRLYVLDVRACRST
ncbi:MAG: hypothetical protein WD271_06360 [Acidimicrobiia bacterium]